MASDFVLDWEKALGYRSDPFVDKVLSPASQFLVDRVDEKEKFSWFFIKGFFYGSVLGENGVGKTTLLKWLEERLNSYNKVHCIYINAAVFKDQINIPQQIITPLLTLVERFWSKPHTSPTFDYISFMRKRLGSRKVALLIDNAHNLTDRNMELIKSLREDGLRIQVIASTTQSDYEKSRLQEFGSDELNISLRRLTIDESVEMVQKRINAFGGNGIAPFTKEALAKIYERADKNPRQFLHLCRDEAIKALIHKDEQEQKVVHDKPKAAEPAKPGKANKKSFLSVRFDKGSQSSIYPENPKRDSLAPPSFDDKRNLFTNERYNQALIDKLASAKPKKKVVEQSPEISDIDRIIKDISKTMKEK